MGTVSARLAMLRLVVARLGERETSARLNVPVAILKDWLTGESAIPDAKVLRLVDLIDETADR